MIPRVMVAQPQLLTVTNWDEYPGHLQAVEMVVLKPQVSGYLESIHFQDGAEVKAGDLLFVIDPKPYQAELDRNEAQCQEAETHLELTKNDLKRAETLRATRAISDEEYDSRSKAVRQAEALVTVAHAMRTTAQINLGYTQIKAPINGRIGRRAVTPGNLVQGGNSPTELATLVSMSPMYGYFDANESTYLTYRKNGSAASVSGGQASIPCLMAVDGGSDFAHTGTVDFFDNQVDEHSGTIRMRAVFGNEDRSLVPGLFATVRVPAGPAAPALFIPEVTINSDQGNKYVLVVGKTNTVEIRPIVVGRVNGSMRAVLQGLTAEDRVIVNGQMMIMPRAGTPVEVLPAAPPAGAPASAEQAAK